MRLERVFSFGVLLVLMIALTAVRSRGGESRPRRAVTTRPAATRPARPIERAPNPHWSVTSCRACHEREDYAVEAREIDAICLRCHDGLRAPREPHPVGRTFASDQVRRPQGWPAPGGVLGCVTCHDIGGIGHLKQRPADNPAFLRGPHQDPAAFCGTCHVSAPVHRRHNPHVMLKADGSADARACGFCHTGDISRATGARERTGDAQLRGDPIGLCLGCHTHHTDWFEPGHIGHPLPDAIREHMIAREGDPGAGPAPDAPTWLPLDGDRIVCSTCHNPHQRGVFPRDSVLSRGAQPHAEGSEPSVQRDLPLRGLGKELCSACHNQ